MYEHIALKPVKYPCLLVHMLKFVTSTMPIAETLDSGSSFWPRPSCHHRSGNHVPNQWYQYDVQTPENLNHSWNLFSKNSVCKCWSRLNTCNISLILWYLTKICMLATPAVLASLPKCLAKKKKKNFKGQNKTKKTQSILWILICEKIADRTNRSQTVIGKFILNKQVRLCISSGYNFKILRINLWTWLSWKEKNPTDCQRSLQRSLKNF